MRIRTPIVVCVTWGCNDSGQIVVTMEQHAPVKACTGGAASPGLFLPGIDFVEVG